MWTAAIATFLLLAGASAAIASDFAPGGLGRTEKAGLAGIARERLEAHTTASGELYNRNALTAAHRSLPFGTLVRVTNVQNKRSVIVRINDRAAAAGTHVIDLTPRAGNAIGLIGISTAQVSLDIVGASGARLAPPAADEAASPPVK